MFVFLAVQLQILMRPHSAMLYIKDRNSLGSSQLAFIMHRWESHVKGVHKYGTINGENKQITQKKPILHKHKIWVLACHYLLLIDSVTGYRAVICFDIFVIWSWCLSDLGWMIAKYEMHKISKSLVMILEISCTQGTYFAVRGLLLLSSLDLLHLWYSGQVGLFN